MIVNNEDCDFKYDFMEACKISKESQVFIVPETDTCCILYINERDHLSPESGYTEDMTLTWKDMCSKWAIITNATMEDDNCKGYRGLYFKRIGLI